MQKYGNIIKSYFILFYYILVDCVENRFECSLSHTLLHLFLFLLNGICMKLKD